MKWIKIALLPFLMFAFYCTEVTSPPPKPATLSPEKKSPYYGMLADLVNIRLANYDSLVVENKPAAVLEEQLVNRIQFGQKITGRFVAEQDSTAHYSGTGGNDSIRFTIPVKVNEDFVRAYHFTLRFILQDSSRVDIDTTALMYKFPYSSTKIFLKIFDLTCKEVTDFWLTDSALYFISRDGLFAWDLQTSTFKELHKLKNNIYLTGHSTYLFLVKEYREVYKYNIQSDSVEAVWDLLPTGRDQISGIFADSEKIYVLIRTRDFNEKDILGIYDLDGNLIQSHQLDMEIWGMHNCAVYDNTLFVNPYRGNKFIKLDLNTFTFSEGNRLPSPSQTGFQFKDGRFYFLDGKRLMIGYLPVDEIF